MEGRGATVRADLYKPFDIAYKNAIVVVASNKLPASEAQGSDETFRNDIWAPLCTRVKFVYTSFAHKSSEIFPYCTAQLANAIKYLSERMNILKEMEELDSVEPEHMPEEELLGWSKENTKKQDTAFNKLIEENWLFVY